MRIRQPISFRWRIVLGISSIILPLLLYTAVSTARQSARRGDQRADAAKQLADIGSSLEAVETELQSASPASRPELESRRERLLKQREAWRKTQSDPDAVDRTVPTWSALWEDGLLRAVYQKTALGKEEYWLWEDSVATLSRLLTGLLVGVAFSVIVGLLMGCFDPAEAFLLPPLAFLAKIPPTAMLAAFFVLVGTNFRMYVVMIVFGMLPTLAQAISASVRKDVHEELIFKAYTLGASQVELVYNVIYKTILPRVLDAVRLQIGPALVLLVAAEWMVAGEGFGYRLRLFYQRTDMTIVYVYCFLLGVGGLAADYLLIWMRRRICPWFGD